MSYLETALITASDWVRGTKSSDAAVARHKQQKEAEAAGEAERLTRMQAEFGTGWKLFEDAKTARDNPITEPTAYQRFIWAIAAGEEVLELRAQALQIIKRWKLSSAAINADILNAKRFLGYESNLDIDPAPLFEARVEAQKKVDALKEQLRVANNACNEAYTSERELHDCRNGHKQIRSSNPRLFASDMELDDIAEVRQHYNLHQLLW
jgi:hypothetical protein